MIGFFLLAPMIFLSTVMTAVVAMLVALSVVVNLAMGVLLGSLIFYAAGFMAFIVMMFS